MWLSHCRRYQPLSSSLSFSQLLPYRCPQPPRCLQVIWQRWYALFISKMWHVHSYYNESCVNLFLLYVCRQDIDCRCCRTLCWWEYLELRVGKWQEVGEICIMGSFIILTAFRVFWGWQKSMELWEGERRISLTVAKLWLHCVLWRWWAISSGD